MAGTWGVKIVAPNFYKIHIERIHALLSYLARKVELLFLRNYYYLLRVVSGWYQENNTDLPVSPHNINDIVIHLKSVTLGFAIIAILHHIDLIQRRIIRG